MTYKYHWRNLSMKNHPAMRIYLGASKMAWHGLLEAEFHGPKYWVLTQPLTYELEKSRSAGMDEWVSSWTNLNVDVKTTPTTILITAPVGYQTDLASIHRIMWNIISPWDIARAAVIHDVLYGALRKTVAVKGLNPQTVKVLRAQADNVFRRGMDDADPTIPNWKIFSCFWSVRPFGRWAIRKQSKFDN